MEVGAVKQAFNNELILMKKKLNQARTQVIHKLTRKAKTLTNKKVPEKLKEKLNRKAESAVKEVLIIKKIKTKDLAKFMITHTEELKEYLNKPIVDQNKACARLVLHKALQDKYKFIRGRFANVSIKDLFMSRQERIKLKKEAREKQKNKKKGKDAKKINTDSEWKIEDINMKDNSNNLSGDVEIASSNQGDDESQIEQHSKDSDLDIASSNESQIVRHSKDSDLDITSSNEGDNESQIMQHSKDSDLDDSESDLAEEEEDGEESVPSECEQNDNEKISDSDIQIRLKPVRIEKPGIQGNNNINEEKINKNKNINKMLDKAEKKHKDVNKNRNFNEKILKRKFKKVDEESSVLDKKVVDPFFITSTGDQYMSLAEPHQPDEIREIHKQGNRKLRRAVMFGHVPKTKPNSNHFEDNSRFNSHKGVDKGNIKNKYNNQDTDFNERRSNFNEKRPNFNNKTNFNDINNLSDEKPEKLHPSWEAKKRQSGILPFLGKKIVFDES